VNDEEWFFIGFTGKKIWQGEKEAILCDGKIHVLVTGGPNHSKRKGGLRKIKKVGYCHCEINAIVPELCRKTPAKDMMDQYKKIKQAENNERL